MNTVNGGLLNPEMMIILANKMIDTFQLNKDQAMALIQIGSMLTSGETDAEKEKLQSLPITIIHGKYFYMKLAKCTHIAGVKYLPYVIPLLCHIPPYAIPPLCHTPSHCATPPVCYPPTALQYPHCASIPPLCHIPPHPMHHSSTIMGSPSG